MTNTKLADAPDNPVFKPCEEWIATAIEALIRPAPY